MSRTTWWWLLVVAILVGSVLRLTAIDTKSLWFDEAFTVQLSERSLEQIWAFSSQPGSDPHPRGFKTVLHYWIDAFGRSELAVRLPTAYASILNMALLGLLARRLFGRTTALIAVSLLAVAPLDIWYAQEVRMYMWVTTFGLLFAVLLTIDHWLVLPGLLLTLTAGLYVDIPMLPLSIGLVAVWLATWWLGDRRLRPLAVVAIAVVGSWLLLLPIIHYYTFTFDELNRIFVIREFRDALGLPAFAPWQYLSALAAIAVLIAAGVVVARRLLLETSARRWIGLLSRACVCGHHHCVARPSALRHQARGSDRLALCHPVRCLASRRLLARQPARCGHDGGPVPGREPCRFVPGAQR